MFRKETVLAVGATLLVRSLKIWIPMKIHRYFHERKIACRIDHCAQQVMDINSIQLKPITDKELDGRWFIKVSLDASRDILFKPSYGLFGFSCPYRTL